MKIYILVEQYFNGCDFWPSPVGYFLKEDNAYLALAELEQAHKELNDPSMSCFLEEVETEDE